MRKIVAAAAAIAVCCCIARGVCAQTQATATATQKKIVRLEERWLANENSPAAFDEILADDFVHVLPEGIISKKEHIAYVRAHPFGPFASEKKLRNQKGLYSRTCLHFEMNAGRR